MQRSARISAFSIIAPASGWISNVLVAGFKKKLNRRFRPLVARPGTISSGATLAGWIYTFPSNKLSN